MPRARKKTEFGVELAVFAMCANLTYREIAEKCGVKYGTLLDTTTGRAAGIEVIPKVRAFMSEYRSSTDAGGGK